MSGRLFISYRKTGEAGFAGRLYDRLEAAFNATQIFMDVTSIKPGRDFVLELQEQVAKCDILLAIVGRGWIAATDESGRRRLDIEDDWVRVEIETALRLGKLVIPVLVNGAPIPDKEELPQLLQPLLLRQVVRLSHETFSGDAQRLCSFIREAFAELESQRKREEAALQAFSTSAGARSSLNRTAIDDRFRKSVVPSAVVRVYDRLEAGFPAAERRLALLLLAITMNSEDDS